MPKAAPFKKFEPSFEPFIEFNTMVAETAESSFKYGMDSMQGYAAIGMDNLNTGLKISTMDDLLSYSESQKKIAQKVGGMIVADLKAYSDMGMKFFDNVKSLMESNMKTSMAAATEAVKAA